MFTTHNSLFSWFSKKHTVTYYISDDSLLTIIEWPYLCSGGTKWVLNANSYFPEIKVGPSNLFAWYSRLKLLPSLTKRPSHRVEEHQLRAHRAHGSVPCQRCHVPWVDMWVTIPTVSKMDNPEILLALLLPTEDTPSRSSEKIETWSLRPWLQRSLTRKMGSKMI